MSETEEVKRRAYPGVIPSHKALDPTSESYDKDRWERGHEQRRLKAHLRGNTHFAHGRRAVAPIGFQPIMWPVTPKQPK